MGGVPVGSWTSDRRWWGDDERCSGVRVAQFLPFLRQPANGTMSSFASAAETWMLSRADPSCRWSRHAESCSTYAAAAVADNRRPCCCPYASYPYYWN